MRCRSDDPLILNKRRSNDLAFQPGLVLHEVMEEMTEFSESPGVSMILSQK